MLKNAHKLKVRSDSEWNFDYTKTAIVIDATFPATEKNFTRALPNQNKNSWNNSQIEAK